MKKIIHALFTDFWTIILVLLALIFTPEPINSTAWHVGLSTLYVAILHAVILYRLPGEILKEIEELKEKYRKE